MQIVRSTATDTNVPLVIGGFLVADSQTINVGDLLQVNSSSRKLEVAVASSTTIVGIANQAIVTTTATAADTMSITPVRHQVVRIPFATGGTKTTFAQTDLYTTAFNISNKTTLNPDNTTNGMCHVQGYNNSQAYVDVIFAAASLANIG